MIKPNVTSTPRLRFPEFRDDWKPIELKQLFEERNELPGEESLPLYSLTIEAGVIPKSERYERSFLVKSEEEAYKVMHRDDFAFNPMNLRFGALARHKGREKVLVSKYYNIFYCNEHIDPTFCENYLTTYDMIQFYNRMSTGSLEEKRRVHYLEFIKFRLPFPTISEQRKIAAFLSAVDERIGQLARKKELLLKYKKGAMQQIFSQNIRFKDDNGNDFPDWKDERLGRLTKKVESRNRSQEPLPVYSISNQYGFIPQSEQFDGVNSESRGYDTSQYKIVGNDTWAYNPARINVGSIGFSGAIGKVQISSLYVCFKTTEALDDAYLGHYLGTSEFNKDVLRNVEGGVRDYLFYENFSRINFPLPSLPEQKAISDFLSAIDIKIRLVDQQLEKTKNFKKGLLQQMFV